MVIWLVVWANGRRLVAQKKLLEQKVQERTEELSTANEEIMQQRDEIGVQRDVVEEKNEEMKNLIEELKQTNVKLEKLSIVASKTDNAVIIADEAGNIEYINEALTRLTGYGYEEYLKEKGVTIQQASANPEIKMLINKCIDKKESVVYETENLTKKGKEIWLQTTLTPIMENGKLKNLVAIDTDITTRKKAEDEIKRQKELIEQKNIDITDSINYASRIQSGILPTNDQVNSILKDGFIFYKPREVVSGDFYWIEQVKTNGHPVNLIAAIDCTGHGVPGAFLTIIVYDLLNKIVLENDITDPGIIFNELNSQIMKSLHQKDDEESGKDGMDMALCTISPSPPEKEKRRIPARPPNLPKQLAGGGETERKKMKQFTDSPVHPFTDSIKDSVGGATLHFAGAYNPLYLIRNNELTEIEANRYSIGGGKYRGNIEKNFITQKINIRKGDRCYIFSDGYADQPGGPKGKRFMKRNFKELLLKIHKMPAEKQKEILNKTLEDWRGDLFQMDDILVMGMKF